MSLVYRIETDLGKGAYGAGVDWGWTFPCESSHPGPESDSGISSYWRGLTSAQRHGYSFGFRNEAQMRAWFYRDEWMDVMRSAGLRLAIYEVEDGGYHYGHAQAIFRKDMARLIETRELKGSCK